MVSSLELSTGGSIPVLGFGTWGLAEGKETESILEALKCGYRHIDTAKIYNTESNVAEAIQLSGISREDIFITTKLWNEDQGYESTLKAIDESLSKLGTTYVDLYLVHWPTTDELQGEDKRLETWKAMEEIYSSGRARSIGVSNYSIEHLDEMKTYATVLPSVNQFECHPLWNRQELVDFCHKHNVVVTQYAPLTRKVALEHSVICEIADRHNRTPAQIMLRWGVQRGNVVIPKSSNKQHIRDNADIFSFTLSDQEMSLINDLDKGESIL